MSLSIRGNGVTGVFFLAANSKKLVNKLLCIPLSVVYPVQFYFLVVFPGIGQFQEPQSNSFATLLPEPKNPVPLKRFFMAVIFKRFYKLQNLWIPLQLQLMICNVSDK